MRERKEAGIDTKSDYVGQRHEIHSEREEGTDTLHSECSGKPLENLSQAVTRFDLCFINKKLLWLLCGEWIGGRDSGSRRLLRQLSK